MTGVDWLILAVLVLAVVKAAINGFFHEAFGIAGLVVGYLVAAWQYQRVAAWFSPYLKSPWLAELLGYFIIFAVVMVLAALAGKLARWFVKEVGLSFFDRVLGGVVGLVSGSLIVSVLLVSMTAFAPTSKWLADSALAPYFQVVGRAVIWVAPAELRARFYQGLDLLRRGQQAAEAPAPANNPAK